MSTLILNIHVFNSLSIKHICLYNWFHCSLVRRLWHAFGLVFILNLCLCSFTLPTQALKFFVFIKVPHNLISVTFSGCTKKRWMGFFLILSAPRGTIIGLINVGLFRREKLLSDSSLQAKCSFFFYFLSFFSEIAVIFRRPD